MPRFQTADLIDLHPHCASCVTQFRQFGRITEFCGRIRTVKCYDDNVLVRQTLETPSLGEVLVVDGAGYLGSALLGDQIASLAIANGWAGVIINGAVRDSMTLRTMAIGVKALGTNPRKSGKDGVGQCDIPVSFGAVIFDPGSWVYSDDDGVLVAQRQLV
jgi:regulator of ribonuclease activity A